MNKKEILNAIRGGLIVSCQAEPDEPLGRPDILAALAHSALNGGAAGIRASLPENIKAIRQQVSLPVIGIYKNFYPGSDVFITPTAAEIDALARTGIEILAMDATFRPRPAGERLEDLVARCKKTYDILLMADVSTMDEGLQAAELGFDLVGTTLSGYTKETAEKSKKEEPDFELIRQLAAQLPEDIPLIAEGRIWTPGHAIRAFEEGAFAIVVGSAITRPHLITKRFSDAIRNVRQSKT
jgi:N-acylglucosamine-6-phosphate 2-epimerase